uniref:Secreted protein n=1 Tax=Loa loa TaxID=7209 RepID=A0A1I7VDC4_LOALO
MIRSLSIILVWILAVEAGRITLYSGLAVEDRGNGTEEEKWNNEIDNGDNDDDDENFTNENSQDSDIYVRTTTTP